MNLSGAERLSLSILLRRQHEAEPNVGYDHQAEIIERGYTSLYSEVFGMTAEEELSPEVQEETFKILGMFRALHPGYEAGAAWDPSGDQYYQKFRGFDGNDGDGHYGFANFLIKKLRKFQESDGEMNSHGPALNIYRQMLQRWQQMGTPHKLTGEQIAAIVGN